MFWRYELFCHDLTSHFKNSGNLITKLKTSLKDKIFASLDIKWLYTNIIIIIIIIMSCRQHGYPWPSLATSPYHSSPPAGLLGYILCPHIAAVCKFGLVVLLLLGHMWGSIGIRHLRALPCFSSSVWLV